MWNQKFDFTLTALQLIQAYPYMSHFTEPHVSPEFDTASVKRAPLHTQDGFLDGRLPFLDIFREIIREDFKFDSAVEIGSGIYGWLANFILPDVNILQTELNETFIKHNQEFTENFFGKKVEILPANVYELPFDEGSLDVVVGANVLDTPNNMQEAVYEIDRCLKPGGHFLHFQDVGPEDITIVLEEHKRRKRKGLDDNITVQMMQTRYLPDAIVGIHSVDFGLMGAAEYLHNCIAEYFAGKGYMVHKNEARSGALIQDRSVLAELQEKFKVRHRFRDANYFEWAFGVLYDRFDPEIPHGQYTQKAKMMVLNVQKP